MADATTKIASDRSDSVAITAIVGIVLSFITLVAVGGLMIYLIDAPTSVAGGFLTLSMWVCLDSERTPSPRPDSPPQAIKLSS